MGYLNNRSIIRCRIFIFFCWREVNYVRLTLQLAIMVKFEDVETTDSIDRVCEVQYSTRGSIFSY